MEQIGIPDRVKTVKELARVHNMHKDNKLAELINIVGKKINTEEINVIQNIGELLADFAEKYFGRDQLQRQTY